MIHKDSPEGRQLIADAKAFSIYRHGPQLRKYTGLPYVTHTQDVADILDRVTDDAELIAAGHLHDIFEDTNTKTTHMARNFGVPVTVLVMSVTDVSKPEDGNRALRKALDAKHLSYTGKDGATLKLADLLSNGIDITTHDPKFAKVFLPEKSELLLVLKHGDQRLWNAAYDMIMSNIPHMQV